VLLGEVRLGGEGGDGGMALATALLRRLLLIGREQRVDHRTLGPCPMSSPYESSRPIALSEIVAAAQRRAMRRCHVLSSRLLPSTFSISAEAEGPSPSGQAICGNARMGG